MIGKTNHVVMLLILCFWTRCRDCEECASALDEASCLRWQAQTSTADPFVVLWRSPYLSNTDKKESSNLCTTDVAIFQIMYYR